MMRIRGLLLLSLAIVATWLVLPGHNRGSSVAATDQALTVMTYNVGDDRLPNPTSTQIAHVIRRAGVPDLLLLQDNIDPAVIAQLAQQLGLPHHLSGRDSAPKVNASLLSRFPLNGAQSLLFENTNAMTGMICADVEARTTTFLACSLYMPSLSDVARQVVDVRRDKYRDIINLLWEEIFHETPRSRSVARIFDWLGKRAAGTVIIGGDFNTFPQSRSIHFMARRFEDALWFTADNLVGTYIKLNFPLRPRIDYLFHSGDIAVEGAAVIRDTAGDHYPVRARMILPVAAPHTTRASAALPNALNR